MFTYLDRRYSHLEIELCDAVSAAMTFRRIFFFSWVGGWGASWLHYGAERSRLQTRCVNDAGVIKRWPVVIIMFSSMSGL